MPSQIVEKTPTQPREVENGESLRKWRNALKQQGYVIIRDFFSLASEILLMEHAEDLTRSAQRLLRLALQAGLNSRYLPRDLPGLIVVPEKDHPEQLCRIEDISGQHPNIGRLLDGTLTEFLSSLLREPYVIFKDKINFKFPGGGAFTPHQDFPAYDAFGPRSHLTAMISLDTACLDNGCVQFAKNYRSDLEEFIPLASNEDSAVILPHDCNGDLAPEIVRRITWEPALTQPCDLVLFDSFVPHYSEINNSGCSRRALFVTYNRLCDGEWKKAYFSRKRKDPMNPKFHFGTPTPGRRK